MELIGVLAVLAILAAVMLPSALQVINRAVEENEVTNLTTLADGLRAAVLDNRMIPGNATDVVNATGMAGANGVPDWADFISSQTNIPLADILVERERRCARRYWFDPANGGGTLLNAAVDSNGNGTYEQDRDTLPAAAPANARAMLISDVADGCLNAIATPASAADFAATWDQTGALGSLTESGTLKIVRINFTAAFERVTLVSSRSSLFGRNNFDATTGWPVNVVALPTGAVTLRSLSYNGAVSNPAATYGMGYTGNNTFFANGAAFGPGAWAGARALTGAAINITVTGLVAGDNGYMDITATFDADPQYQVVGQAAAVTITTGVANTVTFYMINGSELRLMDQAGATSLSTIIKESLSFNFSPGPPAVWGY